MRHSRQSESGSQLIEFSIVLLPLLALVFLTIDSAWAVFAKASMQYAVRQGCRFAVTGQLLPGLKHDDSIKKVVESNSFGFLTGQNSEKNIAIEYYNPSTLQVTSANAGGNIVQVEINDATVSPLMPLFRSATPLKISAVSSDVMESSPGGIPPPR
jgi:hypothetical protein